MSESQQIGKVIWVNGPVVRARGSRQVGMMDVVEVGAEHLIAEVIGLVNDLLTLQVYEETAGLKPGAPVFGTGHPLTVELGPGLLRSIFDGIQRPLPVLELRSGAFIGRGIKTTPLYRRQPWAFTPTATVGSQLSGGAILGTVPETELLEHRVLLPPTVSGELLWLAPPGDYTLTEPVARVRTPAGREVPITMLQFWSVRRPRPVQRRIPPAELLTTGLRVLDTFFPLARGGTAATPGGFGAGKTLTQHSIAKWSDADIVIYVGCGERGNEMTQVLQEFPQLSDPRSGKPLLERTVLIANTSNMPVAAREASIYTGVTIAEYYRDMGYNVALMADSTSRWAEALREISGRLEEMPAEEGYPAYLGARLAEFYERAGQVITLNGARGSVSLIGAVSPPGNDFSEPVTQNTRRFVRCFWALDKSLAAARHYPAINWLESYSEYVEDLAPWWEAQGFAEWHTLRAQALGILQAESRLQQIVKLVGADALPDEQRLTLDTARLLREGFLQQNALDPVDASTPLGKQLAMLAAILHVHERAAAIVARGCPTELLRALPGMSKLLRMKTAVPNADYAPAITALLQELDGQLDELALKYEGVGKLADGK
ncbi:MAG TPA: V-type ATP synthase subunit A [Anaerolineae bacterium]|nr:V-type ATP synthase subunit A [Anaerolineae bacterium]